MLTDVRDLAVMNNQYLTGAVSLGVLQCGSYECCEELDT